MELSIPSEKNRKIPRACIVKSPANQNYMLCSYVGPASPERCEELAGIMYGAFPSEASAVEYAKKTNSPVSLFLQDINKWVVFPPISDEAEEKATIERILSETEEKFDREIQEFQNRVEKVKKDGLQKEEFEEFQKQAEQAKTVPKKENAKELTSSGAPPPRGQEYALCTYITDPSDPSRLVSMVFGAFKTKEEADAHYDLINAVGFGSVEVALQLLGEWDRLPPKRAEEYKYQEGFMDEMERGKREAKSKAEVLKAMQAAEGIQERDPGSDPGASSSGTLIADITTDITSGVSEDDPWTEQKLKKET
jgi:hypothetical protein